MSLLGLLRIRMRGRRRGSEVLDDNVWVTYRYEAAGAEREVRCCFKWTATAACGGYPEEVEVYYDPRDPDRAVIKNQLGTSNGKKQQTGCAITLILTFLTYIAVGRLAIVLWPF